MATPYTGPGEKTPSPSPKKELGKNYFPRYVDAINWHPNYPGGIEKSVAISNMYLAAGKKTPQINCAGGQQCAGQVNTMEKQNLQTIYDSLYGKGVKKAQYRKGDAWDMKPEEYTMWADKNYQMQLDERKKSGSKNPFVYNKTLPPSFLFEPLQEGVEDKWEGKRVILDRINDEPGSTGSYAYAKDTPYYKDGTIVPAEHTGVLGKLQKHPKTGKWGRYIHHGYSTSTTENPDGTTKPGQARFKSDWISAEDGVGYQDGQNKYSFVSILGNKTLDKAKSDLKAKQLEEKRQAEMQSFWQSVKPIQYNQIDNVRMEKPLNMSTLISTNRYGGIPTARWGWMNQDYTTPETIDLDPDTPDFSGYGKDNLYFNFANQEKEEPYKFDWGDAYNIGSMITHGGAAIHNMMQSPPPTIQMPLTHLSKVDLDTSVYDDMRSQQGQTLADAFYQARKGAGQQSDLARIISGVTAMKTKGEAQIGSMEAKALNDIAAMNTDIQNKESMLQYQQNLQQTEANWKRMYDDSVRKGQAISASLTAFQESKANYADYLMKKEYIKSTNKRTELQDDLGKLSIMYTLAKDAEKSDEYKRRINEKSSDFWDQTELTLTEKHGMQRPDADELKSLKLTHAERKGKLIDAGEKPEFEELEDPEIGYRVWRGGPKLEDFKDKEASVEYSQDPENLSKEDYDQKKSKTIPMSKEEYEAEMEKRKDFKETYPGEYYDKFPNIIPKQIPAITAQEQYKAAKDKYEEDYAVKLKEYNDEIASREQKLKDWELAKQEFEKEKSELKIIKEDIDKKQAYLDEFEEIGRTQNVGDAYKKEVLQEMGMFSTQDVINLYNKLFKLSK